MQIAGHGIRSLVVVPVLTSMLLAPLARPVRAAWGVDPVQVQATSANCPLVSANDAAAFGALVIWQEQTASGGLLRAQHLLASGDVDDTWGGPVAVSGRDAARTALGSVTDGTGGGYVWWMEDAQLHLSREVAQGSSSSSGAEWTVPGTRDLPGGIYFARASDGRRVLDARVIVLP